VCDNPTVPRDPLPLRARFGYGAADGAASLVWAIAGGYLVVFATDVARLPAAAVGTMLLVVRLVDAVADPAIGLLIDRTRTRWGRSRPYLLWASVPLGALAVLSFSSPDWPESGRLAWAYGTYLLLSIAYSFASIPLVSILAGLSGEAGERMRLSVWKMAGNALGSIAGGAAILPLVAWLGGGDDARGYRLAMILLGLLAAVLLLYGFATLRERVVPPRPRLHVPWWRALRGNAPLALALAFVVLLNVGTAPRVGATVYFFRDYLGRADLVPVANLAQAGLFGGLLASLWLTRRVGKRDTLFIAVVAQAAAIALPLPFGTEPWPAIVGTALASAASGAQIGTMYALLADIIDFGDWRTGVRAEGLIGALATLAGKAGVALGGALTGWLLAAGGYDPDATTPSEGAISAIRFCYYGLPIVLLAAAAVLLRFYRIDGELTRIAADLERRAAGADAPQPPSSPRS